jgi:hypothetical protein
MDIVPSVARSGLLNLRHEEKLVFDEHRPNIRQTIRNSTKTV